MSIKEQCSTCKFSRPSQYTNYLISCHLNPPIISGDDNIENYLLVFVNYWCGEFEASNQAIKDEESIEE